MMRMRAEVWSKQRSLSRCGGKGREKNFRIEMYANLFELHLKWASNRSTSSYPLAPVCAKGIDFVTSEKRGSQSAVYCRLYSSSLARASDKTPRAHVL